MKRWVGVLTVLLVVGLVAVGEGQRNIGRVQRGTPSGSGDPLRLPVVGGGVVSGGASCADSSCTGFLVCQNFEGSGYDNSETWTPVTTGCTGCIFNPDYTTGAIRGNQSLRVVSGNAGSYDYVTHSNASEAWYHWTVKLIDAPNVNFSDIVTTIDSGQTQIVAFTMNSNLTMNIAWMEQGYSTGSTVLSVGTVYHMWAYIKKGTGSNGIAWLKISENSNEPQSYEISVTNGAWTTDRWAFYASTMHDSSYEFLVDQMLAKTSAIGDVCN